jgi:hypothetical protein
MPLSIKAEWTAAGKKSTQYRHPNTDPLNPDTWSLVAHDMAVIAARGGSNASAQSYPIYTSPNWWDAQQAMIRGGRMYNQAEVNNELDNKWSNTDPLNGAGYAVL